MARIFPQIWYRGADARAAGNEDGRIVRPGQCMRRAVWSLEEDERVAYRRPAVAARV